MHLKGDHMERSKKIIHTSIIGILGRKQQIRDEILLGMSEKYPEYQFYAILDNDYSE